MERSAGESFRAIPELAWLADDEPTTEADHAEMMDAGTSWVAEADGRPVGFLCAEVIGSELHVWELAVQQDSQRRGLGRRLMEAAATFAREQRLEAVTLTTFRDVAWNAPFYERLGFVTLPNGRVGPRLTAILQEEIERGLPGERRCAMRLVVSGSDRSACDPAR